MVEEYAERETSVKADGKQNSAYSLTLKMEAMFLRNVG
jgi:hypothetical protein